MTGSGFADGATVQFKEDLAGGVGVRSPTLIKALVPRRTLFESSTVDVTVTVGVATTPTGSADEFTYTR
ncbi:hypothetical protein [Streptomyces sp. CB02923]|uniref:hypothetical protein n=1 Tax=Streptomyces sp. CB02923 TaxID=1718985 RepID=UPI001F5B5E3B|nr:hypothetical protein [Streptomyces sp. CB02923]